MALSDLTHNELKIPGYERVIRFQSVSAGLDAIIAVHSTVLGAALGGTRAFAFPSFETALEDVLRLSKGMTYKAALADTKTGGGKSVIILKPGTKVIEEALLRAFSEAVNFFEGSYICAEDVGIGLREVNIIAEGTPYVAGLPIGKGSGDPSVFTARGVFQSMRATAKILWGKPSLKGKKIAIQGLGHVGMHLANFLFWEGAELFVTDIRPESVKHAEQVYGAKAVSVGSIFSLPCDLLAPCAMGGSINPETIEQLSCAAVVGAANNQLKSLECATLLNHKGILYVPDYIANAGGLINVATEFEAEGYNPVSSLVRVDALYDCVENLLKVSAKKNILPIEEADHHVEALLYEHSH